MLRANLNEILVFMAVVDEGSFIAGGQAMGLVVLNLAFTFLVPGVSIGGHVGGLVGGALCALAFSSLRRSPALATVSIAAVGVLSVAVALAQV